MLKLNSVYRTLEKAISKFQIWGLWKRWWGHSVTTFQGTHFLSTACKGGLWDWQLFALLSINPIEKHIFYSKLVTSLTCKGTHIYRHRDPSLAFSIWPKDRNSLALDERFKKGTIRKRATTQHDFQHSLIPMLKPISIWRRWQSRSFGNLPLSNEADKEKRDGKRARYEEKKQERWRSGAKRTIEKTENHTSKLFQNLLMLFSNLFSCGGNWHSIEDALGPSVF